VGTAIRQKYYSYEQLSAIKLRGHRCHLVQMFQTYQAEKKMHPAVILPAALSGLVTQPLTAQN
jgi:hypothetical protein